MVLEENRHLGIKGDGFFDFPEVFFDQVQKLWRN